MSTIMPAGPGAMYTASREGAPDSGLVQVSAGRPPPPASARRPRSRRRRPCCPGKPWPWPGPDRRSLPVRRRRHGRPHGRPRPAGVAQAGGGPLGRHERPVQVHRDLGPFHCWQPKGHGRVDLAKALQASCNLAFLAWATHRPSGGSGTTAKARPGPGCWTPFGPFLGRRMPDAEGIRNWTWPGWAKGTCCAPAPKALLRWLIGPRPGRVPALYRRLLLSFYDETLQENAWWVRRGARPCPAARRHPAWAVGGNGPVIAVLRLPAGHTRAGPEARFVRFLTAAEE